MKTVGKILKLKKKLVETNPSQNLSMNYLSQLAQGIFLHAIKCQTSFVSKSNAVLTIFSYFCISVKFFKK